LHLSPNDAVFVVFKDDTKINSRMLPLLKETIIAKIDGAWKLAFQKDRGLLYRFLSTSFLRGRTTGIPA